MTANIQVYNLATREKLQDLSNTSIVDLSTSSVVKVDLYKEDIKQYVREGNNLVLVLNSGEKILIEDFFVQFNDQPQSQLVLLDEECGFLWFDYNNGAVYFKDITGLEQIVFGKSTNFWPWILGGLLLGGGIAALIDDDDKDPANPTTVTGNDGKGIEDDGAITGTVVAEDKDGMTNPDFTIINPPENGTATIDPDTGEWSYVPNEDWYGTDSFTVVVTDDKGVETEFVVTVDVDPEQDAFDDVDSTEEDTPITLDVLANDAFEGTNPVITHVNGQPITEGNTVAVDNGDVTLTDGKLVFQPAPNYAGPVEFEYTAVTDEGVAETAQVNITVTPEDDGPAQPDPNKPTQGNDAGTGPEDTVITGDLDVVDPDGINNPNFTLNTPPQNGTVSIDPATGEWIYTPKPDWHGTDSFTVTVTDDQGFTTDIPVNVTVEPEQDAFDDVDSTEEDTPITLDILANDAFEGTNPVITHVNGQPITEGNTVAVDNGDVTLTDGKLVFQPAPNYAGPVEFEYTAVTDEGVAETAQVNITVTPEDDGPAQPDPNKPTQGNDAGTGPEDTVITGDLDVVDPDGINNPNFTLNTPPQNGTVSIDPATGEWIYTPKPDWHGTDSFTVTVTDDQGFTTDIPVNVTVEPEQDAFDDVDSTEEDTPITLDILANDAFEGTNPVITHVNGQPITEGNTVAVDNGDVTLTDGKLVFQPAPNYAGPVEFEYTAVTDEGVAETAQVNITVTAVNDAPVSEDDQIETPEDTPITGIVPATDPDDDDLTFVVGEPPKNGTVTVDPETGEYTYTPNPDYNGPDEFTVVITDPEGEETTSTIVVDVTPVNDPPVAEDNQHTTEEDVPVNGQIDADDADGDPLTYEIGEAPKNGTVTLDPETGEYTYTPNPDYNGPDEFTVIVTDPNGETDTATVVIDITPVNDAPVSEDDQIETPEDTPITGTVPATDPDDDDLTFVVGEPPKNGTVTVDPETGEYTYTPNPDYSGPDEFTVVITDPDGEETTSTIVVDVRAQDDSEIVYLMEDSGVVTSFTQDDPSTTGRSIVRTSLIDDDVKNDPGIRIDHFRVGDDETIYQPGQEYVIQNYGTIQVNADGTFAFTPAKDFYSDVNGQEIYVPPIVHYTLADDAGLRETSTVAFHVEGENDAPVALDTSITITNTPAVEYYFDLDDFDVSDVDHDITDITLLITELPTNGVLEYFNRNAWVKVQVGDRINYSTVDGNRIRYKPNDNVSSESYDSFKFQPDDGVSSNGKGEITTLTIRLLERSEIESSNAVVEGTEGNDFITGAQGVNQTFYAKHGNDFIFADGINPYGLNSTASGMDAVIEHLKTQNGNKEPDERALLDFLKQNPQFFPETGGNDIIYAGAGEDMIFAGGGDDIIYASQGNDYVHAGAGADTLIYDVLISDSNNAGHSTDTWDDFDASEDTIQFAPGVLVGITQENAAEYIELSFNAATNTVTLSIDRDGKQNEFVGYKPMLILENQSSALDLQKLIDDGRIVFG